MTASTAREPARLKEPLAYRVNEFCRRIGIGRSLFYELVKTGKIKTALIGGRRIVPASEAHRLLSISDSPTEASAA